MRAIRRTEGNTTWFIIADLDPACHDAARALYYSPVEGGFAKGYPADTPNLDLIYRSFARHVEEMVLQMAEAHPTPWDQALSAFASVVEGQGVDWWLAGSGALAVRGLDVEPHDLDLVTDEAGAVRLGELLLDHLVEPVLPSTDWIARWFGRAFLHARVEWVGDVLAEVDSPQVTDFGPVAAARLETVSWRGDDIRVPPLDLQLQVTERRGLVERAAAIRRALGAAG